MDLRWSTVREKRRGQGSGHRGGGVGSPIFFVRQVLGRDTLREKNRKKAKCVEARGGAGETGKMHKILGRDESLDGDEGRDEGGTGSGPVAVGGEAGWAARG